MPTSPLVAEFFIFFIFSLNIFVLLEKPYIYIYIPLNMIYIRSLQLIHKYNQLFKACWLYLWIN